MTEDTARLRREIEEAFASTPYPGDAGLVMHNQGCRECAEVLEKYKGKHWRDYKDDPLSLVGPPYRYACMSFTPQAFRYYAPVALLAAAESYQEADVLTDYFLGTIVSPVGKYPAAERIAVFTPVELRALLSFLAFMREQHPLDYNEGPSRTDLAQLEDAIKARLDDRR